MYLLLPGTCYSPEETEYWCGGCVVPLALALPVGDVRYHLAQADKRDKAFVVTGPCQRTVTLPIEPQVHSTDFVGG